MFSMLLIFRATLIRWPFLLYLNMEKIKLMAKITFYDSLGKRQIPIGVMFYAEKERAIVLVSGGFADIIERPKEDKVEEPKEVIVEKPKHVAKKTIKKTTKVKKVK